MALIYHTECGVEEKIAVSRSRSFVILTNRGKSTESEASTRGRRGRWDTAGGVPVLGRAGDDFLGCWWLPALDEVLIILVIKSIGILFALGRLEGRKFKPCP